MPTAALAVCATPGCPNRVTRGYCATHDRTSSRNHYGVPRQQRGHGAEYDRARAALLASGPYCAWNCGRRATTADYAIPFARGGTLADLVPACGQCNYGRGARMTHEVR